MSKKKIRSVVHFSGDDFWYANPRSRYHVMKAYHKKGYRVLWINPIGIRFPSVKKKNFGRKILRKAKSLLKLLRKYEDNFYVFTPFLIPKFSKGFAVSINRMLLKIQLDFLKVILKLKSPIIFYTTPGFGYALNYFKNSRTIYYLTDQYVLYRELNEKNIFYLSELDKNLYENCDLILCSSLKIYDDMLGKRRDGVHYFPHKVDFDLFQGAKNEKNVPSDISKISKPIIGYYGTLSDSNDWDIIKYSVENRPNYNFVFIGIKDIKVPDLESKPNVYFLGRKEYHEIPSYGNRFDVCIMFWIRREWIKNCSPLKLKEYLALGKPVVSTYIEELELNYRDIVYISKDKVEFLNNLDAALKDNNDERVTKGVEYVNSDSWDKSPDIIEELFASYADNNDSDIISKPEEISI